MTQNESTSNDSVTPRQKHWVEVVRQLRELGDRLANRLVRGELTPRETAKVLSSLPMQGINLPFAQQAAAVAYLSLKISSALPDSAELEFRKALLEEVSE